MALSSTDNFTFFGHLILSVTQKETIYVILSSLYIFPPSKSTEQVPLLVAIQCATLFEFLQQQLVP